MTDPVLILMSRLNCTSIEPKRIESRKMVRVGYFVAVPSLVLGFVIRNVIAFCRSRVKKKNALPNGRLSRHGVSDVGNCVG